jgi:nucleoside-diphosphate-sugar epimerase
LRPAILICGLGFIGSNLSKFLNEKKHRLVIITRKKIKNTSNTTYINVNPQNKNQLFNKIIKFNIKYIINTFGKIDHSNFNSSNEKNIMNEHFIVTKNLIELGIQKKIFKFIQIGSADEYGNLKKLNENSKERPNTPYGLYKSLSTSLLQSLKNENILNSIVLRLFTTYGPNQSQERFIPFIINQSKLNKKYDLTDCKQHRDFIHIDDLIKIIYLVTFNKKNLDNIILNVGTSKKIKLKKIVEFITKFTGGGDPQFGKLKYNSKNYNMVLIANNRKLLRYIGKFQFKDIFKELPKLIDKY